MEELKAGEPLTPSFLIQLKTTCLGMMGWALLHQLAIKNASQT